jgi:hypothetical protein
MKIRLGLFAGMLGAAMLAGSPASAGLLGDSVTLNYNYPTESAVLESLGTETVSPTAPFSSFGQTAYLVTDSTLEITDISGSDIYFLAAAFNGVQLVDNTHSDITGVTIDSSSNLAGLTSSDISFDASDVWVNLEDLTTNPDTYVQLDIATSASTAVPEPSPLSLVLAGLALICGAFYFGRKRVIAS